MTVRAKLTDRQLQITVRISAAVLDMSALLYMQSRTQCRKSGRHGTAATFGKTNITFVHTTVASVLCLLDG